jgi:hypothetical protein
MGGYDEDGGEGKRLLDYHNAFRPSVISRHRIGWDSRAWTGQARQDRFVQRT